MTLQGGWQKTPDGRRVLNLGFKRWDKNYHFHRRPRTTYELRANQENRNNHDGYRVKYRQRDLPNAWDDLMRGQLRPRSWKNYRRTQWR